MQSPLTPAETGLISHFLIAPLFSYTVSPFQRTLLALAEKPSLPAACPLPTGQAADAPDSNRLAELHLVFPRMLTELNVNP